MPTLIMYHPAAELYNSEYIKLIKEDLIRIKKCLKMMKKV